MLSTVMVSSSLIKQPLRLSLRHWASLPLPQTQLQTLHSPSSRFWELTLFMWVSIFISQTGTFEEPMACFLIFGQKSPLLLPGYTFSFNPTLGTVEAENNLSTQKLFLTMGYDWSIKLYEIQSWRPATMILLCSQSTRSTVKCGCYMMGGVS